MNKGDGVKDKVHYDPGWNDPPLYSYDAMNSQPNPNKKVNILNKRVAYPMSQQKVMSGGMNPTLPPTNNVAPLPPSSQSAAHETSATMSPVGCEDPSVNKEESLIRVKELFRNVLEGNAADIKQGSDEINRRLSAMFKMWEDDRLNPDIHRRIIELAKAMKTNDLDRADHLHVGLAVDHPSVCSSWIPGVRRLIQHLKSCNAANDSATASQGLSEPLQQNYEVSGDNAVQRDLKTI